MGKYPKSKLNDAYSNWHWQNQKLNRDSYLSDVDKIWVELRAIKINELNPVAVFDIKEINANVTLVEEVLYDWFERKGLPVYIVKTTISFTEFAIKRWKNEKVKVFNQDEYIEWINELSNRIF